LKTGALCLIARISVLTKLSALKYKSFSVDFLSKRTIPKERFSLAVPSAFKP
jgi:hypothetical protein